MLNALESGFERYQVDIDQRRNLRDVRTTKCAA
jgi:hypothetical protein